MPDASFKYQRLPTAAIAAIEALQPGEVTEPLELDISFFLFELVGRRVVPFADVKDALRRELEERRPTMVETSGYRNVLMRSVVVEVLPAMFR